MNPIDSLFVKHPDPVGFARAYIDHLAKLLADLDFAAVGRFIEILLESREKGNSIFFCGNGGSAATASHFANDIGIGTRSWSKPFRAISLGDNNAVVTAIANDDGYDKVFVNQLLVLMKPGDVVVAISASGNSPNVVEAVRLANERGNTTVALTGFDGGKLRELAQLCLHVPTSRGEYGPVEDIHMVIDHLVGNYLMRAVAAEA